jgi:hypothetical protein
MQKHTRRPHGISSRKVSISITEEDLAVLAARAKQAYGNNVSAVIHEMVETLRRELALDALLNELKADQISDAMLNGLRVEVGLSTGPRKPRRRLHGGRAA